MLITRAAELSGAGTLAPTATTGRKVQSFTVANIGANTVVVTLASTDTITIEANSSYTWSGSSNGRADELEFDGITVTGVSGDLIQIIWEELVNR